MIKHKAKKTEAEINIHDKVILRICVVLTEGVPGGLQTLAMSTPSTAVRICTQEGEQCPHQVA
jgi:hypothetical protein